MSRQGSVYRRCGKCNAKVTERRCGRCGYDKASWTWIADVHRAGEARKTKMSGGHPTKGAAVAALQAELAGRDAGTFIEPRKVTVAGHLADWLAGVKASVRGSTWISYRRTVRVVSERIGDTPLQSLTRLQIKALYAELGAELSAKTVHNYHLALHKALSVAVEDGLLRANPADRAHRLPTDRPELAVWTPEETALFLASVRGDRLYGLWRLLVATGMRRGEALGLRWADVDLDAATVTVARQLVRGPEGIGWGAPKTRSGRRVIDLDPATVAAVRAHRAGQNRERLAWGPAYDDTDLIFANERGRRLDPDGVTGAFARHVRCAGLRRVTLHALRHGHATMMLMQGVPVHVVQRRLGHANPSVTLSFYAHVLPQQAAEAASRFAALIDAAG